MTHRHGGSKKELGVGFIVAGMMLLAAGAAHSQSPVAPLGTGTESDPYQISELGHLVWMGDTVADSAGKYYSMTADIDASATATWNDIGTDTTVLEGFRPIRARPPWSSSIPFCGTFDGNGHTITRLVINRLPSQPGPGLVGLFAYVDTDGQVRDMGMIGGTVTGAISAGGLAGVNSGTITYCYAAGTVKAVFYYVGGLVGTNSGTMSNCYATGVVTGDGLRTGGLVGLNCGTLSNCYVTGKVASKSTGGGLVGENSGTVSSCYANATVSGPLCIFGGLVGANSGTVLNCYATGLVKGQLEIGGLVGGMYGGTVTNCYAIGTVLGDIYVGGLAGRITGGTVSESYWDIQNSGQSTSAAGIGKTTAEMKQQATFLDWDFVTIWGINENVSYPYLQSITTDSDGDGVIDQLDACPGTIPGAIVDAQGCPVLVPGDFNRDGDVDGFDISAFMACGSGPQVPYVGDCGWADFDDDADVDQIDFGVMQRCLSGENLPGDPNCEN